MDYYKVLDVHRDCSKSEIKKAYHKIALKNHPDKNSGNDEALETFKKATEAYEILSNDDKRKRYDNFGTVEEGLSGLNHLNIFEQLFGDNSLAKNFFGSSFFSSQDLAMISNNYESTTIIINGNEKITKKTVHTPSGVRTTEYREYLNGAAPKQDNDSRLGIHSRGGFQ
jgi:DnaJ-class molecular chaperone